ncbi:cytochrome b [Acidisoma cladoniae]|jgi:cytochrome b561|uniref:cytochrome b n=1 Tax=Acidisoma cladoniae TaxID=3040935 RepID=UPI002549E443|nr:cytochrome b [Acidisoma sp. PAMC 29798]
MNQPLSSTGRRYTSTAQALHWITAALMTATLLIAWVMVNMPDTARSAHLLFTLHKSIGLTILAIVAIRLFWRASHPAPPLPGHLARWDRLAASMSHWMLYVILLGMPVSGYVMESSNGYPITYFGVFTLPGLPKSPELSNAAFWLHVAVGQWLVYALILLHLAATAWHVAVRRDGVLNRMLPPQRDGD